MPVSIKNLFKDGLIGDTFPVTSESHHAAGATCLEWKNDEKGTKTRREKRLAQDVVHIARAIPITPKMLQTEDLCLGTNRIGGMWMQALR